MNSVGRVLGLVLVLQFLASCGGEPAVNSPAKATIPIAKELIGDPTLTALGSLQISDTLADAKVAFPAPPGSQISAEPELTLSGESHFGWTTDKQVFDAFGTAAGLTTVSLLKKNLSDHERSTEVDRDLERFDEPLENAEGNTVAAYLWRDGDYVRIVVDFFAGQAKGVLKVVGTADSLQARGFPLSNLAELVAAFDETAVQ